MNGLGRPPQTLRELFGTCTVCVACAASVMVTLAAGLTVFVVVTSALEGSPDAASSALVELWSLVAGLMILGLAATLATFGVTTLVRYMRNDSTGYPIAQ